jgi:hypothetical protein
VSQQTTNRYFDELARAMAEGSLSRRGALKLIAGTAIAALIPSRALADDDCVRVCHVPKTATGDCDFANAVTRCVSRRERRRHLENHDCDCRGRCRDCLTPECLPVAGTCMANDDCCSGFCFDGRCLENLVNCTCQTPGLVVGGCTSAACADTTALNQFCTSKCLLENQGTGVASECVPGCGP